MRTAYYFNFNVKAGKKPRHKKLFGANSHLMIAAQDPLYKEWGVYRGKCITMEFIPAKGKCAMFTTAKKKKRVEQTIRNIRRKTKPAELDTRLCIINL